MAIGNLTGQTFGRLTVLGLDPKRTKFGQTQWRVKCSCGNPKEFLIVGYTMKSGNTTSCGCLRREKTGDKFRKHGLYGTSEYKTWIEISRRCYNKKFAQYKDYGGRGIGMSDEWKADFKAFLRDMGNKPTPNHSIDRIDNNGNYEKGNCRWVLKDVQANNTNVNVYYEYEGQRYTIAQLGKKFGIAYTTMRMRLIYLPIEAAVDKTIKFETYVFEIDGRKKPMKDWLRFAGISLTEYVKYRESGLGIKESIQKGFQEHITPSFLEVSPEFIKLAQEVAAGKTT